MRLRTPLRRHQSRRYTGLVVGAVAVLALAACTGSAEDAADDDNSGSDSAPAAAAGSNDEEGDKVTIGFSAPAADHGWMAAITNNVRDLAEEYPDIDLQVAEGTNDVNLQISQVETFINDEVDAIVLLPFDGAAMTPVALKAMEAGIPVINVDREFDDPNAARVTVLGDNYGMGVSAGQYICEQAGDNTDAIVAEIAGIDSLPLTQDRSQGFEDALSECGLDVDDRARPSSPSRAVRRSRRTCSRPRRRSTSSGTTTTTRVSASWPPSRTPAATSSSWSVAPARPTPCARSRRTAASSRRRSSTRPPRAPTASSSRACWCRARR